MDSRPSSGSPRSTLRPYSVANSRFPFFVSYGEEAKDLKVRVKGLIEHAFSPQLSDSEWESVIEVWDWRDMVSEKAPKGGKTNDLFVERARRSSATIVMLRDRMPPGTEEELLAILDEDEVHLIVIWLNRPRRFQRLRQSTEVSQFLKKHQNDFSYVELENLDSEQTWLTLTGNLVALLLRALRSQGRPPYVEALDAS
ncbi:MAG TPA: hypothetical protein VEQ41_07650 [Solirubrobacterales bacterium]|nr:hypothetical protein [Solirubrobacterales bacterium]